MIENWLRGTHEKFLVELKEKCDFYKQTTEENNYYPYECVTWIYNKGPDGKRMSYEAVAKELGITPKKAHESKWVGLLLLGYRAAEHPPRTKRIASEIERDWQTHLAEIKEAQKEITRERQPLSPIVVEENKEALFWENRILKDLVEHEELLKKEINELLSLIFPLREELQKWESELRKCKKLVQLTQKEKELIKNCCSYTNKAP